uniref:DUF834 domain-containing protein n=1 Tax=Oryza punctata TaxID=4537 RepID=A0A0E0LC98_ORYPU
MAAIGAAKAESLGCPVSRGFRRDLARKNEWIGRRQRRTVLTRVTARRGWSWRLAVEREGARGERQLGHSGSGKRGEMEEEVQGMLFIASGWRDWIGCGGILWGKRRVCPEFVEIRMKPTSMGLSTYLMRLSWG